MRPLSTPSPIRYARQAGFIDPVDFHPHSPDIPWKIRDAVVENRQAGAAEDLIKGPITMVNPTGRFCRRTTGRLRLTGRKISWFLCGAARRRVRSRKGSSKSTARDSAARLWRTCGGGSRRCRSGVHAIGWPAHQRDSRRSAQADRHENRALLQKHFDLRPKASCHARPAASIKRKRGVRPLRPRRPGYVGDYKVELLNQAGISRSCGPRKAH